MMTPSETAAVLVQALPYIQRFAGRAIVVKIGGSSLGRALDRALAQDLLLLRSVGVRCVLVHGGGPQIDSVMEKMGLSPRFEDGLRVTDGDTLDVVRMVLGGKINRDLVSAINAESGDDAPAVGVSGEDARLLVATPSKPALGFVGSVSSVRSDLIDKLLDDGLLPVVSTIASGDEGQSYNVNADEAARAIAAAIGAEKILYLTAAPGLLADPADEASLVPRLTSAELRSWLASDRVSRGMIPKLRACAEAVEGGVASAHIIDGRVEHALLIELLTDQGIGTMITRGQS